MVDRVVHVKKDPYTVWVARGSKWGNPFRIGGPHPDTGRPVNRGEAIELYKEWIARGEGRWLLGHLGELEGQTLGCFCAGKGGLTLDDPLVCHAQVLMRLLVWRRRKIREKGKAAGID